MSCIIKPLVTEKMTGITEKLNKFGFIVDPSANKLQIKAEVEAVYAGKNKSRYTKSGMVRGRTNRYKKAVVTLKEGDTIDFYSNL